MVAVLSTTPLYTIDALALADMASAAPDASAYIPPVLEVFLPGTLRARFSGEETKDVAISSDLGHVRPPKNVRNILIHLASLNQTNLDGGPDQP